MKAYRIIYLVAAIFAVSCNPTEFFLNTRTEYIVYGENLADIESLDVSGENHLVMYPGSRIALRVPLISLMTADISVDLQKGEGLRIFVRTVVNDFENRDRIQFDFTTHGSVVRNKAGLLSQADSIVAQPNQPRRIIIKNDGPVICITADCDTVYSGRTNLNCTEFIIIETMPNTTAKLYGINFAETENIKKSLDVLLKTIKEDY